MGIVKHNENKEIALRARSCGPFRSKVLAHRLVVRPSALGRDSSGRHDDQLIHVAWHDRQRNPPCVRVTTGVDVNPQRFDVRRRITDHEIRLIECILCRLAPVVRLFEDVLGGSFDLPHAETHTAVLPHAMQYNATAEPEVMQRIAETTGKHDAPKAMFELGQSVDAKMALRDLGLREADLDKAADIAVANPYWNPRPVERGAIRELLQLAWAGDTPA